MHPASRSTFDILFRLTAIARADDRPLETAFLLKLLYLCQAAYAAKNGRRKLMPATFLSTAVGPIEPDIFLVLKGGFKFQDAVELDREVETFLKSIWRACKDKTLTELDLMLSEDTAISAAAARGRNSEITLEEMAAAYKNGLPRRLTEKGGAKFPDGTTYKAARPNLDAAPTPTQEIRFTADGRSVTKWTPSRRVESKAGPLLN
ncbi:hypothetical protein [Sneathiella sp.]|uniref:hypothetical protein n=1 Tax=Sneathiella sp. TaxID=1964365 RepID=UPI0035680B93